MSIQSDIAWTHLSIFSHQHHIFVGTIHELSFISFSSMFDKRPRAPVYYFLIHFYGISYQTYEMDFYFMVSFGCGDYFFMRILRCVFFSLTTVSDDRKYQTFWLCEQVCCFCTCCVWTIGIIKSLHSWCFEMDGKMEALEWLVCDTSYCLRSESRTWNPIVLFWTKKSRNCSFSHWLV